MSTNRYDEEPTTGGPYLTLKSGDKARVRIMSTPLKFEETFVPKDGQAPKTAVRWGWAVLHKFQSGDGAKQYAAKTFKGGATIYGAVRDLIRDEDWGDPTKYDIEISRSGEGLATEYTVIPKPKSEGSDPKPEHLALFAEFGYDAGDPDWADGWLTKQYVKRESGHTGTDEGGADPFAD